MNLGSLSVSFEWLQKLVANGEKINYVEFSKSVCC